MLKNENKLKTDEAKIPTSIIRCNYFYINLERNRENC